MTPTSQFPSTCSPAKNKLVAAACVLGCLLMLTPFASQAQSSQSSQTGANSERITPKFEATLNRSLDAWAAWRAGTGPCPIGDCSNVNSSSASSAAVTTNGNDRTGIVDVPYQGGSGTVVPRGNTGTSGTNGTRYTNSEGLIRTTSAQGVSDPTGGYIDSLGQVLCESIPGTVYRNNRCQCSSGTWDATTFSCVGGTGTGNTPSSSEPATGQAYCEQGKDKGWKWDADKGQCLDSEGNEVVNCDNAEGGVGDEIKKSLDLHTEMASVSPVLEKIFEANQECFAGASGIFDLSPTIPSLLDLITSALDALKQYAKQKICTAINEVTKYINAPIAVAIQGIIKGDNGAIYNMSASLSGELLKKLYTGEKGSKYHEKVPEGYKYVNTNMLNLTPSSINDNSKEMADAVAEMQRRVSEIQGRKATAESQIQAAENSLSAAERALQQCEAQAAISAGLGLGAGKADCGAQQRAVAEAEAKVNSLAAELADLENQMTAAINVPLPEVTTSPIQNSFLTEQQFISECKNGETLVKGGNIYCLSNTMTASAKTYANAPSSSITKASVQQTKKSTAESGQTQKKSGVSGLIRSLGDLLK